MAELAGYFPATIELMSIALILTVMIAVPLGVFAAVHKDGVVDNVIHAVSITP